MRLMYAHPLFGRLMTRPSLNLDNMLVRVRFFPRSRSSGWPSTWSLSTPSASRGTRRRRHRRHRGRREKAKEGRGRRRGTSQKSRARRCHQRRTSAGRTFWHKTRSGIRAVNLHTLHCLRSESRVCTQARRLCGGGWRRFDRLCRRQRSMGWGYLGLDHFWFHHLAGTK